VLLLAGVGDLGDVSGRILGAVSLISQQLFFNVLMVDFGFFSNCECIYRFFQSFTGYQSEHGRFLMIPEVRACTAGM